MSEELEKNVLSIIPKIVWNELEDEQKEEIKKAIEDGISVSYHHNDRKFKKNLFPSHEVYANFPANTDVITIGDDFPSAKIDIFSLSIGPKRIMLRASSERGVTSLDNPIPDNIPNHIWEQLPDVFQEDIIDKIDRTKEMGVDSEINITYIPKKIITDDLKKSFHLADNNDYIRIESRFGFSGSVQYYDVKNGLSSPYAQGMLGL